MSLLPAHLEMVCLWLPRIEEVVVVDSASKDGTVEYLRSHLQHPRLRFFEHPPGLYQSWNFGLRQIQAPFAYVSAVGDNISGEGLSHLYDVAKRLDCDVVASRPKFLSSHRQRIPAPRWPIDDICEALKLGETAAVEGLALFVFAVANSTGALMGSSASSLYRTACIQDYPFPTDFGTAGDAAWGLLHALDIRLGVTTEVFSDVLDHPKSYNVRDYEVNDLPGRLVQLALETARRKRQADPALDDQFRAVNADALLAVVAENLAAQRELERFRHGRIPWVLNPRAWQARGCRAAIRGKLQRLKLECLARLKTSTAGKPFQAARRPIPTGA